MAPRAAPGAGGASRPWTWPLWQAFLGWGRPWRLAGAGLGAAAAAAAAVRTHPPPLAGAASPQRAAAGRHHPAHPPRPPPPGHTGLAAAAHSLLLPRPRPTAMLRKGLPRHHPHPLLAPLHATPCPAAEQSSSWRRNGSGRRRGRSSPLQMRRRMRRRRRSSSSSSSRCSWLALALTVLPGVGAGRALLPALPPPLARPLLRAAPVLPRWHWQRHGRTLPGWRLAWQTWSISSLTLPPCECCWQQQRAGLQLQAE